MRRIAVLTAVLLLVVVGALQGHDLFLKLADYFLAPHTRASVTLLNGTFEESENAIGRERMTDVSIAGPDGRVSHPPASRWRDSANTAVLDFETGDPGTYVIGVSTKPRVFDLSGEEFDEYLRHDGVLDVYAARREAGELGTPATERYSKHVKAIAQVGDRRTDTWARPLGYPVEFVPLDNPYEVDAGALFEVRFLSDGEPVADQRIYAGYEGYRPEQGEAEGREPVSTRTDADGIARFEITRPGTWYVRAIHMVETGDEPGVDYESNWATLSFQVR